MKYTRKLPDENINNPKENHLFTVIKLAASLVLTVCAIYIVLIYTVDFTVEHLSPESEAKLLKYAKIDMDIKGVEKSEYLQNVTDRLSRCAKLPYDVRIYILKDDTINAYALPGGKIIITEGMLKKIKNENELASVIGHELGHFKHKDHLKALGKSLVIGTLSMLASDNYGSLFTTTLQVTNAKYSQSQEIASDLFGIDLMQCAYGSVKGADTLFSRMDKGEKWKYFLASHPDFHKRVERMRKYIDEKGYDKGGKITLLKNF